MPAAQEVFRDFVRYSGDGKANEPVGHPLPVGDPSSGAHSPSKKQIRDWASAIEALPSLPAQAITGSVSLRAMGADGTGTTDASSAFQAALDLAGPGEVIVPPGVYPINGVVNRYGTTIRAIGGNGEVTANASGTASTGVQFQYSGLGGTGSFMLRCKADTLSQWIKGCNILGRPHFTGQNLCSVLIDAQSVHFSRFDVEMSRAVGAGLRLSAANGALSQFNTIDMSYIYGADAAAEASNGLVMDGNYGTGWLGCTQNEIRAKGLIKNGDMVRMVGHCDNNRLIRIHATRPRVSGAWVGTGNSLAVYLGNESQGARINDIQYVCGPIFFQAGTFGNFVDFYTSEGGIATGTGQLSIGKVIDYTNGKAYGHRLAPLSDTIFVPVTQMVLGGAAARAVVGRSQVVNMPKSATSEVSFTLHDPIWGAGVVSRVDWLIRSSAAGNAMIQAEITETAIGAGMAVDTTVTEPTPVTAEGFIRLGSKALTQTLQEDAILGVTLSRLPTNPSDTCSADVQLVGARVRLDFNGPSNLLAPLPAWREQN